jgi:hypothetical protein
MSLNPRAIHRWPTDSGAWRSRRKCRPSSRRSVVTRTSAPSCTESRAQSSPIPSSTPRPRRRANPLLICSISPNSDLAPEVRRIPPVSIPPPRTTPPPPRKYQKQHLFVCSMIAHLLNSSKPKNNRVLRIRFSNRIHASHHPLLSPLNSSGQSRAKVSA